MANLQRVSGLVGGLAAVVAGAAGPAIAAPLADDAAWVAAPMSVDAATATFAPSNLDLSDLLAREVTLPAEQGTTEALPEAIAATPQPVASQTLADLLAASEAAELGAAIALFESPTAILPAAPDTVAQATTEVAQVTRPLYRGVSPFYIGVGGTIGIVDSDDSAVGDFGFNVFGKISLGPRFAVRPMLQFSEDDFNVAVPVTYNFNPLDIKGVSVYPSLGAGVDFGDEIGLLINGGIDVPISRQFTLNSQLNWRVTDDTGLGLSLGVGYNFPVFFE
ncbi:MAG TPA: outer membrane beta-barrel protein [Candidatus Obscuribacterales bacterium]